MAKFYVLQIIFRESEKSSIFVSAHVTKGLDTFTANFCAIFKHVFAGFFYLVVSPVPPLTRPVSCLDLSEMSEKQDFCNTGSGNDVPFSASIFMQALKIAHAFIMGCKNVKFWLAAGPVAFAMYGCGDHSLLNKSNQKKISY